MSLIRKTRGSQLRASEYNAALAAIRRDQPIGVVRGSHMQSGTGTVLMPADDRSFPVFMIGPASGDLFRGKRAYKSDNDWSVLPGAANEITGPAWPGYTAHPNYAGLSYPKQHSARAWPYIGPFYPYPQVPLGWRKVTLEWDDGWWWLDFQDRK